jgi:hypothetical protein
MSDHQAWDFSTALRASEKGKQGQEEAEKARKDATAEYATAEKLYRVALAKRIVELIAEGKPATVAKDLARGDKHVSDLGYNRDVAEGMKEIAEQRAWRHTADRKDIQEFIQWSRIVAPLGTQAEPPVHERPIGSQRAA